MSTNGYNYENNDEHGDFDHEDDLNVELWEPYVTEKLFSQPKGPNRRMEAPKAISLSSMYNFCDVLSNDAVVDRNPVLKMKSSDFPLEINYSTA